MLSFDFLEDRRAHPTLRSQAVSTCRMALGSRSTYPIGALGRLTRVCAPMAGDELPVGKADLARGRAKASPEELRVVTEQCRLSSRVRARALLGPAVTDAAAGSFFADEWKVAPEADRMGYRFRGAAGNARVR